MTGQPWCGPVTDQRLPVPRPRSHCRVSKITVAEMQSLKGRQRIPVLTAYDYPMSRLLDEAGIPMLLVGDSLGMVVLGYPDTTHVTLAEMLHHTRAVARARPRALWGVDLPYGTYSTPEQAVSAARQLVAAGAEYVKAEGGAEILPQVQALIAEGIQFMGHIGMLPQHVVEEGGKYRVKGRDEAGRQRLLNDARVLESAGAFGCVLELVAPAVTREITEASRDMLTIGIGSGEDCDGQILVTPDLIGGFPWFTPRFVTPHAQTGEAIRVAVTDWANSVRRRSAGAPTAASPTREK